MGLTSPMSIEHLKQQRNSLISETEKLWDTYMENFPILPLHRVDARYVVSTDAIVNDEGPSSESRINDIQEFYAGQEVDLLDYVEYISTFFRSSHIIVFVRDNTGYIERYVTIGN